MATLRVATAACEVIKWRAGSHVLDIHGALRPVVHVQGEGVVVWAVDVGQHERLLVFRFRVHRCDVVFVRVADHLAQKERRLTDGVFRRKRSDNSYRLFNRSKATFDPTFTAILKDTSLMVLRGG